MQVQLDDHLPAPRRTTDRQDRHRGPAPAALQISLLGSLRVTTASAVLDTRAFPGLKPKQLLELLVCERGHRVSKGRLADQLWGDALPRDHAATLETYVSVLRRTLDPCAGARSSVVVTEHGGYRIGPDGVEVDLDVFDRLRQGAVGAEPVVALSRLHQALSLVRGQVLEDEPYAAWAQPLRAAYLDRRVQALVDAGRLSLVVGDASAAMDLAQQAVVLNPLAESAYQVVMTAAYALWRQDEALAAFDRCRRLLGEELGADPMDETVALYLAILRHEQLAELMPTVSAGTGRPLADPPAAIDLTRAAVPPPPAEVGLLGRERELALLDEAVARARAGRMTLALVSGCTGVGKTALVEQLAKSSGLPIAANRCSDLESLFPYLALSLALRRVLPEQGDRALPALDRLLEKAGPLDQLTRLGIMETLTSRVVEQPPFVIWLDDAQWADPETITTLGYLQRRCPGASVLVVLTCDRSRRTREALRGLRPDVRVDLGLLSQGCVDALGHADLFAMTAGHPLFVEGWLHARRQQLPQQFSPELCERVLMTCWDAGPQGYQLLSVASGLDSATFPTPLLAALIDVTLPQIAEQLESLVDLGLLTWVGDDVAFSTPALRSILAAALSPARRSAVRSRAELLQA